MGELEPGELRLVPADVASPGARRPSGGGRNRASSAPASAASSALAGSASAVSAGGSPAARPALERLQLVAERLVAAQLVEERAAIAADRRRRGCSRSTTGRPWPQRGAHRSGHPEHRRPACRPCRPSIGVRTSRTADLEDARLRQGAGIGRVGRRAARGRARGSRPRRARRSARTAGQRAVLVVAHHEVVGPGEGPGEVDDAVRRLVGQGQGLDPAGPRPARSGSRSRPVRPTRRAVGRSPPSAPRAARSAGRRRSPG